LAVAKTDDRATSQYSETELVKEKKCEGMAKDLPQFIE
jgi:hypothetical protein